MGKYEKCFCKYEKEAKELYFATSKEKHSGFSMADGDKSQVATYWCITRWYLAALVMDLVF